MHKMRIMRPNPPKNPWKILTPVFCNLFSLSSLDDSWRLGPNRWDYWETFVPCCCFFETNDTGCVTHELVIFSKYSFSINEIFLLSFKHVIRNERVLTSPSSTHIKKNAWYSEVHNHRKPSPECSQKMKKIKVFYVVEIILKERGTIGDTRSQGRKGREWEDMRAMNMAAVVIYTSGWKQGQHS